MRRSLFFLFICFSSMVAIAQEDSADCYSRFFRKTELPADPKKLILLNGTKTISLKTLLDNNRSEIMDYSQAGLVDMDNDGKKELVVYIYSGGAHCCDGYSFYSAIAPNKFKLMTSTWGGSACISEETNIMEYSFYEHFGYFYTCYACGLDDTTETATVPITSIQVRYNKGKLQIVPGDKDLKAVINDNLGKLSEHPYQKIDDGSFDDGFRKEFALNLAVYHYSFGKNLVETQKLFNRYYKFPDAKKIWSSFVQTLAEIQSRSKF